MWPGWVDGLKDPYPARNDGGMPWEEKRTAPQLSSVDGSEAQHRGDGGMSP